MPDLDRFEHALRLLRDLAAVADINRPFEIALTFEDERDAAVFKHQLWKELNSKLLNPSELRPDRFPHKFEMVGLKVIIKHKEVRYDPRIH